MMKTNNEMADLARALRDKIASLPASRVKAAIVAEADAITRRYGALTGSARRGPYRRRAVAAE
jgi:hypothetical protein